MLAKEFHDVVRHLPKRFTMVSVALAPCHFHFQIQEKSSPFLRYADLLDESGNLNGGFMEQ